MNAEAMIKSRVNIILWLFTGCFLIFVMVVVGGITRLTGSGLSITKWDVVTGTLPPMSVEKWESEFSLYQQTPQFKKINSHFELSDFKQIYWWEYIHRLLGRLIGLVFIIPFLWFAFTKQLDKTLMWKCLLLFFMGALQGTIGWYMVSSGLVDIPSVSHYRLALHLITAFITFGLTFLFAMQLIQTEKIYPEAWHKKLKQFVIFTFVLILIQIIYGAFVAGLKAGYVYNTWPLMGDKLIAESFFVGLQQMGWKALFNDISGVQVMHRYLAYAVVIDVFLLSYYVLYNQKRSVLLLTKPQLSAVYFLLGVVLFQFLIGVLTLIYNVPVYMGVLHQAGAFFLFAACIYLWHRLQRI